MDSSNGETQAACVDILNKYVFRALCIQTSRIHWLDREAVVLIPHGAVVYVYVTPGHIKAVRVQCIEIPHIMSVVLVNTVVYAAVGNLEAGNIKGCECPVRRLLKQPVLYQYIGSIHDRQQTWAILAVYQILDVPPPRIATTVELSCAGRCQSESCRIGDEESFLHTRPILLWLKRVASHCAVLCWPTLASRQEAKCAIEDNCQVDDV
mmetsp:Transcript_12981/g.20813  ORF Transcript_12981/g.20813 Transcript_12981/m.20813 type:complete len:208 (+) Transcript_12981:648-1271(+)